MRLLDRMSTLLKADAHGVIESLEERSLLLKQYLREAELEVDRKRAALEALRDEDKQLRERHARTEQECRALDEDVTLALSGGKDDLARFAVRRLLPRRREAAALEAQVEERAAAIHASSERLTEQETKLEALRTRVRVELARSAECGREPPAWATDPVVADEEVELELLRRRQAAGGGR